MDLRDGIIALVYSAKGLDAAATAECIQGFLVHLRKLEAMLAMNESKGSTGPFLVGSSATAPDFHTWSVRSHVCTGHVVHDAGYCYDDLCNTKYQRYIP